MRLLHLILIVSLVLSVSACSKSSPDGLPTVASNPSKPHISDATGPSKGEVAGSVSEGKSRLITLSNGAQILVQKRGGILFFAVEGTISERAFTSIAASVAGYSQEIRNRVIERELDKVLGEMKNFSVVGLKKYPQVAYFTFLIPYSEDLLAALKDVAFTHEVSLSPIVNDPSALKSIKSMTPTSEGLVPRAQSRGNTKGYSGLERIFAPEFVKLAEGEIADGTKVDGSSVRLGITDTGITFNHRTFLADDRQHNRIVYMRDFTREGRVYFNQGAKMTVKPVESKEDEVMIETQVIVTPRLPNLPAGDELVAISDLRLKVPAELREILLQSDTTARLGVLTEASLSAAPSEPDGEINDINGNGKLDEVFPMILVPAQKGGKDLLYVDLTGQGDFTLQPPIGSWNQTGDTIDAFAEKIGFDIQEDQLPNAKGDGKVQVKSASIVGFDPGNHGTHVAGIAAGRKTIANDAEDTLARGVAPAAKILMNRVCAVNVGCSATEAFIDLALNGEAEVINMSLGGLNHFNDGYGVQETLINRLTSLKNVLFVISAGNSGPGRQTVGSPSVARLSLSIGAAATKGLIQRQYQWPGLGSTRPEDLDADFMLFFSSRGPTAAGGFKPNISAPGTELSAVQLNSPIGSRGGLDVYWGTSMSAPTATGAYALLLDAIKKYNKAHPEKPLPADVLTLREVIIQSARPFDMNSYDPITGARTTGQYTWMDEGMGMIDLVSAWKKLAEVRDRKLPVSVDDLPVELEYEVVVSMKNPRGVAYDGSRVGVPAIPELGFAATPAFGTGLYLDPTGTETLRQVYIQRKIPEYLAVGPAAGELTRRLLDTRDEFVLKTKFYGSDKVWLKAGVLDELNCWESETANLSLIGRGVDIKPNLKNGAPDGTAKAVSFNASALNVCINRDMIANELAPGDHGALIFGYRIVNGVEAAIPSFTVPVSITVPHKIMASGNGYEINSKVNSFGVNRNYVIIPPETSLVQITLEVPALKLAANGLPVAGEKCSGVELMALKGVNNAGAFKSRPEARISNCDGTGAPVLDAAKRKLVFSEANPKAGVWDLNVFGQYKYALSTYTLRVDYVNSASSVRKIEGDVAALNGTLEWTVRDASIAVQPDSAKSSFVLEGLINQVNAVVKQDQLLPITNPLGTMRTYPAGTSKVVITTGGSPGNDIDLLIMECVPPKTEDAAPNCNPVAQSGGPADNESASFAPKAGLVYMAVVNGYTIKDEGNFVSTEIITLEAEAGAVVVAGDSQKSVVRYSLPQEALDKSKLINSELFKAGDYDVTGGLVLRMSNGTTLDRIPVRITNKR